MRDRKKIAAIMAAIVSQSRVERQESRVKSQESRVQSQESGVGEGDSTLQTPDSRLAVSLWRVSGRQEIMQMRALWQRRIVPR